MSSASWLFEEASSTAGATSTVEGERGFARRGVVTPFRRDAKQDFANSDGPDVIKANVRQILGTRASDGIVPGELRWAQDFGSLFWKLRHQNIKPVIRFQARAYAVDSLRRWEPRVRVKEVLVEQRGRTVVAKVIYTIVAGYAAGRTDEVETEIQKAA